MIGCGREDEVEMADGPPGLGGLESVAVLAALPGRLLSAKLRLLHERRARHSH
jgi:hypothetical protein